MGADDDITWNRHRDNPQSNEANKQTNKSRDCARCYRFLFERGSYGATCFETHVATGMPYTTVSARFSDLKRDGLIVETGQRRRTKTGSPAAVCIAVVRAPAPAPAHEQEKLF